MKFWTVLAIVGGAAGIVMGVYLPWELAQEAAEEYERVHNRPYTGGGAWAALVFITVPLGAVGGFALGGVVGGTVDFVRWYCGDRLDWDRKR